MLVACQVVQHAVSLCFEIRGIPSRNFLFTTKTQILSCISLCCMHVRLDVSYERVACIMYFNANAKM
jgi:hypothetical protein